MNRKEAIAVAILLSISFVSGVFADTTPSSSSTTTVRTTSVDVVLFNNTPPAMQIWNLPNQLSIPKVNFTTAFSFAPSIGFVHVLTVALTITYNLSTANNLPPQSMVVIVVINGQTPSTLTLPVFGAIATASGFLSVQSIHPGANMINIGLPVNVVLTLYAAHLTIEYSTT